MTREWIRLALENAGFLSGILLSASRHLSVVHKQRDQQQLFANLAIRFKLASVRTVSEAISSNSHGKSFSDSVVAVTIVLAFDEVRVPQSVIITNPRPSSRANGEFPVQFTLGDMAMSRRHVQGAVQMVECNGGRQTLGLNGFLEMLLHKYEGEVGLLGGFEAEVRPCGGAFGPSLVK